MPRAATTDNPRSKGWCFTMYRTDAPEFKDGMTYLIFQREKCPSTGREHWQGYVYFKSLKTMSAVKTALNDNTVHLEKAKGTPEQNKVYCTKEETRLPGTMPKEYGTLPVKGKRNDLVAAAHAIAGGATDEEMAKEFPELVVKHWKGLCTYRSIMESKGPRNKKTICIFISGPAGCGKSRAVNELYPEAYPKDGRNKWWDGYYANDVVNMDDFYGISEKGYGIPLSKMLNIMDRYPCLVEPKGKPAVHFNSDLMFITSNKPPEDMYSHLSYDWKPAFLRRIDFEYKYVSENYNVSYFERPGWYRRTYNGHGSPNSWVGIETDLETDLRAIIKEMPRLPKPTELPTFGPMTEQEALANEDQEHEMNVVAQPAAQGGEIVEVEDDAVVPDALPNAAELMAIEALENEDPAEAYSLRTDTMTA